ncbi:transglycosylase domain-containing protein [Pseudalkalibacillus caeni]|uniref:Peptidoglycan glycosyltransferase n=1 Tax=Exobacillus caeni TaxID=2574798 RepID=A0A5R9F9A1_9BACL|nr:transglycosylase domain-containing protein [Pseudalkalibacillus caeni]TLS39089.1 peptidoglycan glycosyltransferase [Pseudalkalibacillus caeni]
MREFLTAVSEKWKALTNRLEEYGIFKGFRISSKVVWNLFLIFLIFGLMGGFFAGGVGAGYFASLVKDEPIRTYAEMKKDVYNYEETSEIYFADNKLLGNFRSDLERKEVDLKDVSPYLVQAVVSTEDEYFYEHDGVVPKAIARAILQELANSDDRSGGSTLTQQLVKNQILTREVSFERKAKEILLAMRLENFFKKDEILEAYLNVVPFGRNAGGRNIAGVQTAAKGIFGVDAKDLSLPQAAFIAGLPKNPYSYTPFTNSGEVKEELEPGINRMKFVLYRMYTEGSITEEEYNTAIKYDIRKNLAKPTQAPTEKYPYLTFEIEDRAKTLLATELANKAGYDGKKLADSINQYNRISYDANIHGKTPYEIAEKMDLNWDEIEKNSSLFSEFLSNAEVELRKNGYKIYTTIDQGVYDAMNAAKDKVLEDNSYFQSPKTAQVKNYETGEMEQKEFPMQVGSILIENKTGKIISFIGGRDYKEQALNHATQAYRSNGSTMKPLLDYAPAMELGKVQPGYIIPDVPIENGYNPGNYTQSYHGLVTARRALKYSYNVPAVRVYSKLDHVQATNYLLKMGFSSLTLEDRTNASMAIGALQRGVTIEENTNAFGTFANGGKFVDAYMIEKIVDKDGNVVVGQKPKPVDVFSPQTAYLTIDMMRDVVNSGTAARVPGKLKFSADWAGKTGTGQQYRDAWFVAVNPNVSLGVWTGYDKQMSMDHSYSTRNQNLWALFANAAYDKRPELMDPEERFAMPKGIVRRSFCGISGQLPSQLCQEAGLVETDLFNVKYVPSKVDDSLTKGRYVLMNGKTYEALESTPDEFVTRGVMIKEDFFDGVDLGKLLKGKLDGLNIAAQGDKAKENGKKPGAVTGVSASGSALTWSNHRESDIVGYRIYRAPNGSNKFSKIGSVKGSDAVSFNIPSGAYAYYVTAVDVAGNESSPSAKVVTGDWSDKPEPKPNKPDKPDKPKPDKPDEPKPDEPDPENPGDGGNNGDGSGDSTGTSQGNGDSSTE